MLRARLLLLLMCRPVDLCRLRSGGLLLALLVLLLLMLRRCSSL